MTKKFTIFGNPVEHSISPTMHTYAIKGLGLDAAYTKTHLEEASKLKTEFLTHFDAANVTVPHKEAAFALCDEVRGIANKIKAVNTLINENGKMIGYNTDAEGFVKSVVPFGTINNVLIIGAGGTAKALATIFNQKNIDVTILNRSSNRLDFFEKMGLKTFNWENFKISHYDLVVNTTSAGLQDENLPAPKQIIEKIFQHVKFAADAIYNKETPFLKMAKSLNIPHKDGADMLLYQGVLAFDLFYNHQCDQEQITRHMKKAFTKS
ncbi:MAG: shikimate dehydrogenase [Epsilonproteobacteria bacterium]|nr:shikimate dehydrogenase [Campylobacterota bacterium]